MLLSWRGAFAVLAVGCSSSDAVDTPADTSEVGGGGAATDQGHPSGGGNEMGGTPSHSAGAGGSAGRTSSGGGGGGAAAKSDAGGTSTDSGSTIADWPTDAGTKGGPFQWVGIIGTGQSLGVGC